MKNFMLKIHYFIEELVDSYGERCWDDDWYSVNEEETSFVVAESAQAAITAKIRAESSHFKNVYNINISENSIRFNCDWDGVDFDTEGKAKITISAQEVKTVSIDTKNLPEYTMGGISSILNTNTNKVYKGIFYANKEKKKEILFEATDSGEAAMSMLKKVIEEKLIEDYDDVRNIRETDDCFALYCGDTKKIISIRDYRRRTQKFWYDTHWQRGNIDYLIEVSKLRVDDASALQSVDKNLNYPEDCKKVLSEGKIKEKISPQEYSRRVDWAFFTK